MLKQNINYQQIFRDILDTKYPEKKKVCIPLLQKENLSAMDIVKINTEIFGISRETNSFNQKHRSYSKSDIFHILDYQKKHNLNNSQLANYFKLSRNTVAKWKKIFLNKISQ